MKIAKNELRLGVGTVTNVLGNRVFDVANNIFLSSTLSGSFVLAVYQSSETIIGILVNVFAGAFADRARNKRTIMVVTDLICAFACFLLLLAPASSVLVYGIVAVNIVLALVTVFNSPAAKAIIPFAIEKDRIGVYNSYVKSTNEFIRVLSPLISLALLHFLSFKIAVFVNAVTFLVSAYCSSRVQIDQNVEQRQSADKGTRAVLADIASGFRYIISNKKIMLIISVSAVFNFFLAGYNLFLPYVGNILTYEVNPYSILLSAEALGGVIGALLCARINSFKLTTIFSALLGCGLSILGLWASFRFAPYLSLVLVMVFVFSVSLAFFNVSFFTEIQTEADRDYVGRVFSFVFTVAIMFMPVGSFVFSSMFDTASAAAYLVVAAGLIATSLAALGISLRLAQA